MLSQSVALNIRMKLGAKHGEYPRVSYGYKSKESFVQKCFLFIIGCLQTIVYLTKETFKQLVSHGGYIMERHFEQSGLIVSSRQNKYF